MTNASRTHLHKVKYIHCVASERCSFHQLFHVDAFVFSHANDVHLQHFRVRFPFREVLTSKWRSSITRTQMLHAHFTSTSASSLFIIQVGHNQAAAKQSSLLRALQLLLCCLCLLSYWVIFEAVSK